MTNHQEWRAERAGPWQAVAPFTLLILFLVGTASAVAQNYGYHKPKKRQPAAGATQVESGQSTRGNENPTRWRETRRETADGEVRTRVLEGLSPEGRPQPLVEMEEETIRQGDDTTRVIQRLYTTDSDGRRRIVQLTEEERLELPQGGERVLRSVSEPDVNGNFSVVRRETEETRQLTSGRTETQTIVRQPDVNGGFRPVRQVQRVEEETAPGVVNVRETQLLPDGNQRWETHEVREQVVRTGQNETSKEESLYRRDANRKLSPQERTVTREWTDEKGQERRSVEVFSKTLGATGRYSDDRMHLDRRIETTTRTLLDGSQETVQEFSTRPQISPASPLRVSERVIQLSRPAKDGQVRTEIRGETRDVNGRYVTYVNLQTTAKEKKKEAEQQQEQQQEQ
jgi:hypothetical protein